MGTNYYMTELYCPLCGGDTGSVTHLCKLSSGWKPLFYGGAFNNVKDLKRYLKVTHEQITDEYGNTHTQEEFWQMIEMWQGKDYLKDHGDTQDSEGYNFSMEEFS